MRNLSKPSVDESSDLYPRSIIQETQPKYSSCRRFDQPQPLAQDIRLARFEEHPESTVASWASMGRQRQALVLLFFLFLGLYLYVSNSPI